MENNTKDKVVDWAGFLGTLALIYKFRHETKHLVRVGHEAGDHLNSLLLSVHGHGVSKVASKIVHAALLVMLFEVGWVWLTAWLTNWDYIQLHNIGWAYIPIMTIGQVVLAVWTYATGKITYTRITGEQLKIRETPEGPQLLDVHIAIDMVKANPEQYPEEAENLKALVIDPKSIRFPLMWLLKKVGLLEKVWRWHAGLSAEDPLYKNMQRHSHPMQWLALVMITAFVQGVHESIAALWMPFLLAQALVAIGFASVCIYGFLAILIGKLAKSTIQKGVKFVEWASTIAAKEGIAILPNKNFDNALSETGGRVELVDEDFWGGMVQTIIEFPFVTVAFLYVPIFLVPCSASLYVALPSMFFAGLVSWMYARQTKVDEQEVHEDKHNIWRFFYRLVLPLSVIVFGVEALVRAYSVQVLNIWYGLVAVRFPSWWICLLAMPGLTVLAVVFIALAMKCRLDAKKQEDVRNKKYQGLVSLVFLWPGVLSLLGAVLSLVMLIAIISGTNQLQFNQTPVPQSRGVGIRMSENSFVGDLLNIELVTTKNARGILECDDGTVQEILSDDERTGMVKGYKHRRTLSKVEGKCHILMRDAEDFDAENKINPDFGSVTSHEFIAGQGTQQQQQVAVSPSPSLSSLPPSSPPAESAPSPDQPVRASTSPRLTQHQVAKAVPSQSNLTPRSQELLRELKSGL